MKKVIIWALCVLIATFSTLFLHRGYVEMTVIDPDWDPVSSGAVHGWGWPLEFLADNPEPEGNCTPGSEDIFLMKPFLFDLAFFSVLLGAGFLTPLLFRRLQQNNTHDDRTA